jgi:DNA replication protein DnaC
MPRERLITLSRAQNLAFRLSQTENVFVSGGSGSGKTFLANAMALSAAR